MKFPEIEYKKARKAETAAATIAVKESRCGFYRLRKSRLIGGKVERFYAQYFDGLCWTVIGNSPCQTENAAKARIQKHANAIARESARASRPKKKTRKAKGGR